MDSFKPLCLCLSLPRGSHPAPRQPVSRKDPFSKPLLGRGIEVRIAKGKANVRRLKDVSHTVKKTNSHRRWFVHASYTNHWLTSFRVRISGFKFTAFNEGNISIDLVLQKHEVIRFITPIKMIGDVQNDFACCAINAHYIDRFGIINCHTVEIYAKY